MQVLIDEPGRRAELLGRWASLVPDVEWAPVDLVPHNIVLTADGSLVAIDQEWSLRGYDRDVLLVRGLFQSAMQMASRTRPERLRPHETVGDLLAALAANLGIGFDEELLDRFLDTGVGLPVTREPHPCDAVGTAGPGPGRPAGGPRPDPRRRAGRGSVRPPVEQGHGRGRQAVRRAR